MSSEEFVSPLLATGAIGLVFAVLLTMMAAEATVENPLRALFGAHVQKVMAFAAVAAMAASLYYSQIVGFVPCEFCWYQRIAMYPLAVLLAVGVVTRFEIPSRFLVALALPGLGLSVYHYQMQLFPENAGQCLGGVSCAGRYVNEFDFVTIPFMAGCIFLSILLLQVGRWRSDYLDRQWAEDSA